MGAAGRACNWVQGERVLLRQNLTAADRSGSDLNSRRPDGCAPSEIDGSTGSLRGRYRIGGILSV